MRIKGNRMLDEDFYIRGDGTRVFFFDSGESVSRSLFILSLSLPAHLFSFLPNPADDLARIFTGKPAPFPVEVHTTSSAPAKDDDGTSTPATPGEDVSTPPPSTVDANLVTKLESLAVEENEEASSIEKAPTILTTTTTTTTTTTEAGLPASSTSGSQYFPTEPSPWHPPHPLFSLEQLGVDRRLVSSRLTFFSNRASFKRKKEVPTSS